MTQSVPVRLLGSWLALGTALLVACASTGARPHPKLEAVWKDYIELPRERALAIAGDPRRGRWLTTASGGQASAAAAEKEAIEQCRIRRHIRRMRAECVIYASGDEIVWRGR